MSTLMALGFLFTLMYFLAQFARHEYVQEDYENTILDVEGRLAWAETRTTRPFGMRAQMDVTRKLLCRAKTLWQQHKWHQAYRTALQSQQAMSRAQNIYMLMLATHR